jgi:hypothetical protein
VIFRLFSLINFSPVKTTNIMKKRTTRYFSCLVLLLFPIFNACLTAQNEPSHRVFLLGNFADIGDKPEFLNKFNQFLNEQKGSFSLFLTGDLTDRKFDKQNESALTQPIFDLIDLLEGYPRGRLILIPGDRDWNGSQRGGEKNLARLEELVTGFIQKNNIKNTVWAIENGCPGPSVIDAGETLAIVALNSQWWNHPYDKPRPSDAVCSALTPENLKEEISDVIAENENRNVLIVAHHPIFSLGNYGGYFSVGDQFKPFPVIGSFRTAFHANAGRAEDLANEHLHEYIEGMKNLLFFNENIVFASGHERNQQIIRQDGNYLVNSGAPETASYAARNFNTVFSEKASGLMELRYLDDGEVQAVFWKNEAEGFRFRQQRTLFFSACKTGASKYGTAPVNSAYTPCFTQNENVMSEKPATGLVTITPGPEYEAGWFKKIWFGAHYRTTWTTPVPASYLNLDTTFGGLIVLKKGGGRQTTSLKFKAADGSEYTFRSVNKDPAKALNYHLRPTFVAGLLRDATSTQHPYGAMIVAPWMEKLDILHATPKLYVLPDDPKLGQFREKYAGLLGMLEESPGKPDNAGRYFGGAKDIDKSTKLFAKMYQDQTVKVDQEELVRARLFDLWVGDWSKHEDNWKWAEFKRDGFKVYRPIPRDRDHVFSKQDGVFNWLNDRRFGSPNIEGFNKKHTDILSLTNQPKHMDRFLATEASREVFLEQARFIQQHISPQDIEAAIKNLPPELYEKSGQEIEVRLKKRLQLLPDFAERYYRLLAREVDVTGSNEEEFFEIKKLPDGSLSVQIFDKNDNGKGEKRLYDRTFHPDETREVRLWALGGKDVFHLGGDGPAKIRLRAFGGPGDDVFQDDAASRSLFYDKGTGTKYESGGGGKVVNHWNKELYEFDRMRFQHNSVLPLVFIGFDKFTGVGVNAGAVVTLRKFTKDGYHSRHSFQAGITSRDNKHLTYTGRLHQAIRRWDTQLSLSYADPDFFNYFFGVGNSTVKSEALFDDRFYEAKVVSSRAALSFIRDFWQKSNFTLSLGIEQNDAPVLPFTVLSSFPIQANGVGEKLTILPASATLDLDFRDNASLPYRGTRALIDYRHGEILNSGEGRYDLIGGQVEYYLSNRTRRPLTLALRLGGTHGSGDLPWYKLPLLGNDSGLRGYFRNRFAGESAAFFNSEIRYQFVDTYTAVLPVKVGVKVFYDRGRVFFEKEEESKKWRQGYGFGVYLVPLVENFTLSLSLSFSEEETAYPVFSVGTPLR